MAHLYVANVTKQFYQFAYRVPERAGVVVQPIPIGGQIQVSPTGNPDLTAQEIDAIIDQHRKYGILAADELDTNRGPFNGLCYSIGKPVSAEKLRRAMVRNTEALDELGRQIRHEAAVAVNSKIEADTGMRLRELEMSIEEEEPREGYADNLTHISEGVRVTREADQHAPPTPTARRSRARR